jgi:hypothetical protein
MNIRRLIVVVLVGNMMLPPSQIRSLGSWTPYQCSNVSEGVAKDVVLEEEEAADSNLWMSLSLGLAIPLLFVVGSLMTARYVYDDIMASDRDGSDETKIVGLEDQIREQEQIRLLALQRRKGIFPRPQPPPPTPHPMTVAGQRRRISHVPNVGGLMRAGGVQQQQQGRVRVAGVGSSMVRRAPGNNLDGSGDHSGIGNNNINVSFGFSKILYFDEGCGG